MFDECEKAFEDEGFEITKIGEKNGVRVIYVLDYVEEKEFQFDMQGFVFLDGEEPEMSDKARTGLIKRSIDLLIERWTGKTLSFLEQLTGTDDSGAGE